jgi:hypothetical protein
MVTCEFEILNQGEIPRLQAMRSEQDVQFYLGTLFKAIRGQIKCGKIHFSHFDRLGITADHLLRWFPRARFIILYRVSLLDQFVSLKLAQMTGLWFAKHSEDETDREISVDVAELIAFARTTRNRYAQLALHPTLRGRQLTISYEELASDAEAAFRTKIWPFLGIPPFPVMTRFHKQNRRSARECVSNFGDVEPLVRNGVLEHQLEDTCFENE